VKGGVGIQGDINLTGSITMNTGNLTVGGDIITTLGAPADVRALGYQIFTYTNTALSITANTYNSSGLSFSVTSANYGTYMIEFTASITTVNTTTFYHTLGLSTSSTAGTPAFGTGSGSSYYTRLFVPGGGMQTLRVSRACALYTAQTIYGLLYINTPSGTTTMNNASLSVTRIA
jgi:hypothetical protein